MNKEARKQLNDVLIALENLSDQIRSQLASEDPPEEAPEVAPKDPTEEAKDGALALLKAGRKKELVAHLGEFGVERVSDLEESSLEAFTNACYAILEEEG
jgi:hypothetical protein